MKLVLSEFPANYFSIEFMKVIITINDNNGSNYFDGIKVERRI